MLLTALELLRDEPNPDEGTIREALSGNLCICTGYVNIVRAVQAAARTMRGDPSAVGPQPSGGAHG
jgi:carbon-monoxide dehydrogenase small subunit